MRKFFTKLIVFFISFLVGTALGGAIVIAYEASTIKPWTWNSPPVIANCYGPEFNNLYLVPSVDFWTTKGEQIGFIEEDPPKSVCKHDFLEGFIILKKENIRDPDTIAYTKRRTSFGEVKAATIYFNPGTYRLPLIIEHELGHALGYSHVEEQGHIMYPEYEGMDNKFWIP